MAKKPKTISKSLQKAKLEHEKFLRSRGIEPVKPRSRRKKMNLGVQTVVNIGGGLGTGYADSYYSDTGASAPSSKFIEEKRIDESIERPETLREIKRKEGIMRAMNMPIPRDLSQDHPERDIDQKNLITPGAR